MPQIYSHATSLAQVVALLESLLPTPERVAVSSNAEAARLAADACRRRSELLLQSGEVAVYCMVIQGVGEIEDRPAFNTTRFLIVGRSRVPPE